MKHFVLSLGVAAFILNVSCKPRSYNGGESSNVAAASNQNPVCKKAETWEEKTCGSDHNQVVVTSLEKIAPDFRNSLLLKGIVLCYGKINYYYKGAPNPLTEREKAGWHSGRGVWLGSTGCYTGTGYRLNNSDNVTGANVVTALYHVGRELHLTDTNIEALQGRVGTAFTEELLSLCTSKDEARCELVNEKNTLQIRVPKK
jgi:hypothetical protein